MFFITNFLCFSFVLSNQQINDPKSKNKKSLRCLFLLLTFSKLIEQFLSLHNQTFFTSLPRLLVLVSASLSLFTKSTKLELLHEFYKSIRKLFRPLVLSLLFEDIFHQISLVLECVSFSLQVKLMVKMLVDLLRSSIAL
uniref:Candidate secreted effector n=1 Tax=Meloidogyne incognita TaxID=6306 RepID=A0A914LYR9_MELIC